MTTSAKFELHEEQTFYEKNVVEEYRIYDDLSKNVKELSTNLSLILLDISGSVTLSGLATKINQINDESRTLRNNVDFINGLYLPKVQKVIEDLRSELKITNMSLSKILKDAKKYSTECHASRLDSTSLRRKLTEQEEMIVSLQLQLVQKSKKYSHVHEQLYQERNMCTTLGATLSCMIWRACRDSDVVNSMLAWYKFPEFLKIVKGTLESFLSTYVMNNLETSIPTSGSEEGHFVAGMVGIVTNMLASPDGREVLVSSEDGRQVLLSMIEALLHIPPQDGDYLKRLILMALYNTVIAESGFHYLWKQGTFPKALGKNISNRDDECRSLSLNVLAVFTSSPPSWANTDATCKIIPTELLRRISKTETGEDGKLALKIIQNMQLSDFS